MKTRCPQCQSLFTLSESLLQKAAGKVRCGRCECVFNAVQNRCDLLPDDIPTLTSSSLAVSEEDTSFAVQGGRAPVVQSQGAALGRQRTEVAAMPRVLGASLSAASQRESIAARSPSPADSPVVSSASVGGADAMPSCSSAQTGSTVPMNPAPRFSDALNHLKSAQQEAGSQRLFRDVFLAQTILLSRSAQALVASARLRDTQVPTPEQLPRLLQQATHYNRTKEAEEARRAARLAAKGELYKSRLHYADAKQAAQFPLPQKTKPAEVGDLRSSTPVVHTATSGDQPLSTPSLQLSAMRRAGHEVVSSQVSASMAAESLNVTAPAVSSADAMGSEYPTTPVLAARAPVDTLAADTRLAPAQGEEELPKAALPEESEAAFEEDVQPRKRGFIGFLIRLGVFVLVVMALLQILVFFRLPLQQKTPALVRPLNALCSLPLNCRAALGLVQDRNRWEFAIAPSLNNPNAEDGVYTYTLQINLKNTAAEMNTWPTLKLLYVSQDNQRYEVVLSPADYLRPEQAVWPGLGAGQVIQFNYPLQLKSPLRYNSLQLRAQ